MQLWLGGSVQRSNQRDASAAAGSAFKFERAAQKFRPVAQARKAVAVPLGGEVEAPAVIAHFKIKILAPHDKLNFHPSRVGMAKDVMEHFLEREEQMALHVKGRRDVQTNDLKLEFQ